MRLYMKQKVFSWNDKFTVRDEHEEDKYFIEGELFSFGHRLHIMDAGGTELAFVRQKVMSWLPRFFVEINGQEVAAIVKEFTFFKPSYRIEGPGWSLTGDFWAHNYSLTDSSGNVIMTVSKEYFSWGDSFVFDIVNPADEVMCLAIGLAIDACMDAEENSASH